MLTDPRKSPPDGFKASVRRDPFRRRHRWVVGSLAGIGLAMVAAPPGNPNAPDPPLFKDLLKAGFRLRESDHFRIAYDTPYETLRPLMGRLEGTYDAVARFCQSAGFPNDRPGERMRVILYARYGDYTRFLETVGVAGGAAAGVYDHRVNLSAFCDALDSPTLQPIVSEMARLRAQFRRLSQGPPKMRTQRHQRELIRNALARLGVQRDALVKRYNRLVIQHEAAHQIFFHRGVHVRGGDNPRWLVEGIACQFEVPQTAVDGAIRRINQVRLSDLRNALGLEAKDRSISTDDYRAALHSGRWLPLRELVRDSQSFDQAGDAVIYRYAQAWGLVYDLHRHQPKAFADYLAKLSHRQPGQAISSDQAWKEFVGAFGQVDRRMEEEWIGRMARLRYDPTQLDR